MTDASATSSGANTPENGSNSSLIFKVRTRVSNILPNSISKWFSPSDRNGSLRRKRDSEESDEEKSASDMETTARTLGQERSAGPPSKRSKTALNVDDPRATTSKDNIYAITDKRRFASSTPSTGNRRKILGLNHAQPYNFSSEQHTATVSPAISNVKSKNPSDLDTTDEELEDEEIEFIKQSVGVDSTRGNLYEKRDNKRLNIAPVNRSATASGRQDRYYLNALLEEESNNDELEHETLNGNANESGSDSEECKVLTLPNRPQSSAGRINTTIQRADDGLLPRRLGGRFEKSSGLNFSSHLQMHKSLFSDKNMSSSLNNSTTSLNSLNRRQSFNPSIYGSTSALSDSRLLNTNSPFYNGRTMYGGASAYSRRAGLAQRTLRVPTQLRPASSLSTLCSSTNSLASPDLTTSALSTTAKRILELINKSTTPLAEVKKMANSSSQHTIPPLAVKKRFDDIDSPFSKSGAKLMSPRTPYSRPETARKISPLTSELQVPSMSQLLQMKKKLQNDTEKVRELASGSKSILNRGIEEYKLPENLETTGDSKRTKKIRNKISSTRPSKKTEQDDIVEPVNLPHIPFPAMKSVPSIDLTVGDDDKRITKLKTLESKKVVLSSKVQPITVANSLNVQSSGQFVFSKPIEIDCNPATAKKVIPVAGFVFCEPIGVGLHSKLSKANTLPLNDSAIISNGNTNKNLPQLKSGSCLDALMKNPDISTVESNNTKLSNQPSLSDLFKTSNADKWECSVCMIKNDNSKTNCVSCETAKPLSSTGTTPPQPTISIGSSFGSQFKASSDTWECTACMIRNKNDLVKCIACETPKPSSNVQKLPVEPLKPFSVPLSTTDTGFKAIVADQGAKWECLVCMTRNDATRKKCICCEQIKPGAEPDTKSTFSFASSTASKFNFGVPLSEKSLAAVVTTTAINSTTDAKFSFGAPFNSNSSAAPKATFTFGKPVELTESSAGSTIAKASFSFGKPADNSITPPKPTFSFGKPLDQTDTPKASFSFGKPVDKVVSSSKQETLSTTAKSEDGGTATTAPKPLFSFDKSSGIDGDKSAAGNSKKLESKPTEAVKPTASPGGFSFSATPNTNQNVVPANQVKSDTNAKSFVFGAFSTTSSTVSTSASVSIAAKPVSSTSFTFGSNPTNLGAAISNQPSVTSTKTFSFGSGVATTKTVTAPSAATALSFDKPNNEKKSEFSFNAVTAEQKAAILSGSCVQVSPESVKKTSSLETNIGSNSSLGSNSTLSSTTALGSAAVMGSKPALSTTPALGTTPALTGINSTLSSSSALSSNSTGSTSAFGAKNPILTFGNNNAPQFPPTTTTAAPQNIGSSFVFGSSTNTATEVKPSPFNIGPVNPTTQSSFFLPQNTVTTNAFGGSLNTPNVPSTSATPFSFNTQPSTSAPNFGQPLESSTPLPSFGTFASPNLTPSSSFGSVQSANVQPALPAFGAFGNTNAVPNANTTPSFGSGMFGATSNTPAFGSTANAFGSTPTQNNVFYSPSSSGFGQSATESNDEPLSKKSISGFNTVSSTNQGTPPPYQFGANNNTMDTKKPFSFSATAAPSFNFTASPQANPTQQFPFGGGTVANPGVFNFGGGPLEASPNAPFQFSAETNNNPFAPQPTTSGPHSASQQRRKIRAVRRTPR